MEKSKKRRLILASISAIFFVAFEGIFWKAGNNIFDCWYYGCSAIGWTRGGGLTILAILCFTGFLYFLLTAVEGENGKERK